MKIGRHHFIPGYIFLLTGLLVACTPATPTIVTSPTPQPTATIENVSYSCTGLDAAWSVDWPQTIRVLEGLLADSITCGQESIASKLYAAHYNYGVVLESEGARDEAIRHYLAAFDLNPRRQEGLDALARLAALPVPTTPPCNPDDRIMPTSAPPAPPDPAQVAQVTDGNITLNGEQFDIKGVNYYSRQAQWHQFLTDTTPEQMAAELDIIAQAGFNTIRIFLWFDALFQCEPEAGVSMPEMIGKVSQLLNMADQRGLKVIVTLNDLPDLTFRPLYTDWAHYDTQTATIVRQFSHYQAILMWDIRNEGDLDYGARGDAPRFSQEEVIGWVDHISQIVRQNDPYHLITAGWWGNPAATEPYVDVLSFHHWANADVLTLRIDQYQAETDKPLLLEEVGYHTWLDAPYDARDYRTQADILERVISVVENRQIGWVVWTAFDFYPTDGVWNYEHFFGLWDVDLNPKPALDVLPLP